MSQVFDALCFVGVNWGAAGDRRGTRPNGSRKFLIIIDIKILNETIAITRDTHNRDSDVIGAAGLAAGPKGRGNSMITTAKAPRRWQVPCPLSPQELLVQRTGNPGPFKSLRRSSILGGSD